MNLLAKFGPASQRLHLRSEQKRAVDGRIVKRCFSRSVTRAKQFSLAGIPNRKRERSGQTLRTMPSPVTERFDEDFRVGARPEGHAMFAQFLPQALIVVNLSVEGDHEAAVVRDEGLVRFSV